MAEYGMNEVQKTAASHAMNSLAPEDVMHLMFFLVGVIATLWVLLNYVGLEAWREKYNKGFGDIAWPLSILAAVWIIAGTLIFY